ncbi:hypothetical protein NESM_000097500 [Novymonas esmeraldas]|uniref:Kinesin n=1 Tax=Novymonas esmeraldas TaxID=1808958 RepID=A0AAW0F3P8_9TRYP
MLVCLREFDTSELGRRQRHPAAAAPPPPHFERYYTLHTSEMSATIVDVVDCRARKTFSYDVLTRSTGQLYDEVVEPLLMTVLTPNRAAQAVVVIDGQSGHRRCTLLDPVDGVLTRVARAASANAAVAAVSVSAVTLEDSNTLSDVMPDHAFAAAGAAGEPTVLEDTQEQFASVEDAHYVQLDSEATWEAARHRMSAAFADLHHQVISFIFSFHESTGLPNTTMQFISFAVNEVARGMKSSRHAVSSAAALVECRSPTLTFTATKLLYLLKPTLLGHQPGAWVACFSPVSVVEAAEQETFQEAFAVAQTAARLYSSRVAVLSASVQPAPPPHLAPTTADTAAPVAPVAAPPSAPPALHTTAAAVAATAAVPPSADSGGGASEPPLPTASRGVATSAPRGDGAALQPHLVDTPAATQDRTVGSASGIGSSATSPEAVRPRRGSCAVQTEGDDSAVVAEPPRESIQRGASEERTAARYELVTYRTVMERALAKLRAELHERVGELRNTREDVRRERRRASELGAELDEMRAAYDTAVQENELLRREDRVRRSAREAPSAAAAVPLAPSSASSQAPSAPSAPRPPPPPSPPPPPPPPTAHEQQHLQHGRDVAVARGGGDVALLEARVAELTDLVSFHQREIEAHVATESTYRERILDLESALRAKEREAIADKAAVAEARRAADSARAAAEAPSASARASRTSSAVARDDLRSVEERATEVEYRLRDTLDALERERTRRRQLEHLLERRESEEVVRDAAPAVEDSARRLQHAYETQLQQLREEMIGFRAELEQHVSRPPAPQNLGDASGYGATPLHGRPTSSHLSPIPHASSSSVLHTRDDTSAPAQSALRPRRTQSFDEFMEEEPRYELHCAPLLPRRPRRPSAM